MKPQMKSALPVLLLVLLAQPVLSKSDGSFPGKGSYTAWTNANTFLHFGNQFAQKGEIDRALESYKKAIHTYPFDSIYYFNLGNAFSLKGQYSLAEESYRKAIDLESDYFQAWLNLGHTIAKQGRPKEAAKVLRQASHHSQNEAEKAEIEKNIAQFEHLPQMESPQAPKDGKKKKKKKKEGESLPPPN